MSDIYTCSYPHIDILVPIWYTKTENISVDVRHLHLVHLHLVYTMKREFKVGDFIHVYNRGNRKMPIIQDENDKWRFLKTLRFFNDEYSPLNLFRQLKLFTKSGKRHFDWPKTWPPHRPLVKILAYCLRENHFHLLLKEIAAGGVSMLMKKFGDGFTNFTNIKYNVVGRVFQGPYKAKILRDMEHLQYLNSYIQLFNPFQDFPGGIERSFQEFDKAFDFALDNPFCSLSESFGKTNLGIIDRDILEEMFPSIEIYKEFAQDALLNRNVKQVLGKLTLE